ncbi:MAG: preprotein translocase subunit SecE [Vulcanimicrobiota bacterium]
MTAQDATKARKNAKARREKRKTDPGESVAVRSDRGGATVSPGPRGTLIERLVRYWRGVWAETKRVSWPGKPELIAGTITSVVVLMVFASWLGGIDYILRKLFG